MVERQATLVVPGALGGMDDAWYIEVFKQMRKARRKSAASCYGPVYLYDDSFKEAPYFPITLADVELAGMLGIDVLYITRMQKERW